jgi:hypothetical protein
MGIIVRRRMRLPTIKYRFFRICITQLAYRLLYNKSINFERKSLDKEESVVYKY